MARSQRALQAESDSFAELLTEAGVQVNDVYDTGGLAQTKNLAIRWNVGSGNVQVGVRKAFDRWANSVDFVLDFVPDDALSTQAFVKAAEAEFAAKRYNEGYGKERCLGAAYRKARKEIKCESRKEIYEEDGVAEQC